MFFKEITLKRNQILVKNNKLNLTNIVQNLSKYLFGRKTVRNTY